FRCRHPVRRTSRIVHCLPGPHPMKCRPVLNVGDCVPFHFCPCSVMLYVIHKGITKAPPPKN
ncbi:MAG: DUF4433 domain-containing protein, partial [Synechococcus sp. SB0673_bin_10]|nr:DUF4433 domain-containing protein [Synechococcus sp. SB0673_bin_10]